MKLHLFGIPHTITSELYSHCAFTAKILRFPKMMQSVGYEVVHYGVEGATVDCEHVSVLSAKEQQELMPGWNFDPYDKRWVEHTGEKHIMEEYPALYVKFNQRLFVEVEKRLDANTLNLLCCPYGAVNQEVVQTLMAKYPNVDVVEPGIGYDNIFARFKIYESLSHYHLTMGKTSARQNDAGFGDPTTWIVPMSYDLSDFDFKDGLGDYFLYFGRIIEDKGVSIVQELAKYFPNTQFVICGKGDPTRFLSLPNIRYEPPKYGKDRAELYKNAIAVLTPTRYVEPFGSVAVEAQLSGVPVISSNFGGFTETVIQGVTGYRCNTFGDFLYAIRNSPLLDKQHIRELAQQKYDMYVAAKKYDEIFKSIEKIRTEDLSKPQEQPAKRPILHVIGLPWTTTIKEWSHCAITSLIHRFIDMMREQNYHIIHYGVEGADCNANVLVDLMTKLEQTKFLGRESSPRSSILMSETIVDSEILSEEFNKRLALGLKQHYRAGDIICTFFGRQYDSALPKNSIVFEPSCGYNQYTSEPESSKFKVFPSKAWMHFYLGFYNQKGHDYYWHIPHFFDINEWSYSTVPGKYLLFVGRIYNEKGMPMVKKIAEAYPDIEVLVAGAGDITPYLTPNMRHIGVLVDKERNEYYANALAVLAPSTFVEPFNLVAVEAQLSGTPVISSNFGGFTETVIDGKTGFLCATQSEFIEAVEKCRTLDREQIRQSAEIRFDMKKIGVLYDAVIMQLMGVFTTSGDKSGWMRDLSTIPFTEAIVRDIESK